MPWTLFPHPFLARHFAIVPPWFSASSAGARRLILRSGCLGNVAEGSSLNILNRLPPTPYLGGEGQPPDVPVGGGIR